VLISRDWLNQLLMPGGTALPEGEALSDLITGLGLEVEGIEHHGKGVESIVVAEVKAKRKHPNSDKLGLVTVFDGTAEIEVVCGASNVPEPGGRIAFAPEGTTLPGGLTIGAREIRGVLSTGMICSEVELEIGSDGDGIMVLPTAWTPGARLVDCVPGIVDTVYDVSITPNRPDALGHVGVARDLAVKLRRSVAVPPLTPPTTAEDRALVTLSAPDRCGRYFGYAFEGAKVGDSPLWMRVRLHRLGLRPINDVVDITNYVLMEWGQPLHAFDRAKLAEGRVVVRTASKDEPMVALDGSELTLTEDDLVIADADKPQALAGIMGGADSGVETDTTTLLLEAAWFAPGAVRRTARRHQMASDSSYRFERGVDHGEGLDRAVARAAQLITELTGAKLVGGHHVRGETPPPAKITLRPARTTHVLGMQVQAEEAQRILEGLEVEVDASDPVAWSCRAPSHRPDLNIEEDLIEEIMRHHGLDDLPSVPSMPSGYSTGGRTALRDPAGVQSRDDVDALVDAFVAAGCQEVVGFAFADPEALAAVAGTSDDAVVVANPMRSQQAVMRTSLLPGLLDTLALNLARHGRPARLFEVGRTYAWADAPEGEGPTANVDKALPYERMVASVLLCPGVELAGTQASSVDVHSVSGVLLDVLQRFGLAGELRPAADPARWLHPGVQAELWVGDRRVGRLGTVHPDLVDRWDLPAGAEAFYGEIDVTALPSRTVTIMRGLPRFPATSRDLSIDADETIPAWTIVDALRTAAETRATAGSNPEDPPRLAVGDRSDTDVEVLEDYRGQGVEPGRRALLLRLHYRAAKRSVEDAEVQALHDAIVEQALAVLVKADPAVRRR